jgi:hypothetical protein
VSRILALAALSCAIPWLAACGPIGPLPGGALRGPIHSGPPPDWALAREVEQIQVEVRPADPYSVNTWCGEVDGRLYVPTSLILGPDDPNDRAWVRYAVEDPRVRLRIEGIVYELSAARVEDDAERETVRAALLDKYEVEADPHATSAWIFRMEPR